MAYKEGNTTYYNAGDGKIYKQSGSGEKTLVDPKNYKYVPTGAGGTRVDPSSGKVSSGGSSGGGSSKSSGSGISGSVYDEIVRKAKAGEALTNPTPESQSIYDSYASAYSIVPGSSGKKKSNTLTPFAEGNLSVPTYDNSEYMDRINDILSGLEDIKPFSYDPNNDPSYQAFLQHAQGQGQVAFNNQVGSLSTMTGGRPSSWASAAASQAQNQIVSNATAQMPAFQQQAYGQWQGDRNALIDQAQLIMSLDDAGFSRYQQEVNTQFELTALQMQQAQEALQQKITEIQTAMDRTNLLGYVDNEASVVLGVPVGTKSQVAREAIEAKETWLWQQEQALKLDLQKMQQAYNYDNQLINARAAVSGSSGGGGSTIDKTSGGNSYGIKTAAQARTFFNKLFDEDNEEFTELNDIEKQEVVLGIIEEILNDGTLTETKREEILKYIYEKSPAKSIIEHKNYKSDEKIKELTDFTFNNTFTR